MARLPSGGAYFSWAVFSPKGARALSSKSATEKPVRPELPGPPPRTSRTHEEDAGRNSRYLGGGHWESNVLVPILLGWIFTPQRYRRGCTTRAGHARVHIPTLPIG